MMANNEEARRFVILLRHASREKRWDLPESKHQMKNWVMARPGRTSNFGKEGRPLTYALAGRLCDELKNWDITDVEKILHSKHVVAQQTADTYAEVLKERGRFKSEPCPCSKLTPGDYSWE